MDIKIEFELDAFELRSLMHFLEDKEDLIALALNGRTGAHLYDANLSGLGPLFVLLFGREPCE